EFAATDPRFRCESGPGVGSAGAARNLGLDLARGDYLAFLDADDFFAPTMLEELYHQGNEDRADIVLTKFRTVDHRSGDATPADWALRLQYFPRRTPFSPDDLGDYLFFAVHPAAWNKLFRADFIRRRGLRFQELRRTNDVFFSYMALALAKRISLVEGYLIDYRVGNQDSLQGSLHESPLEFVQALDQLSSHLKEAGLFPKLERAFVNEAVEVCLNSLRKVGTAQAFAEIHEALRNGVFARFGVLGREADYFLRATLANQVTSILELSTEELLFARLARANDQVARSATEVRQVLRDMEVRANATRLAAALPSELSRTQRTAASDASGPDAPVGPDVSVVIPVHNTELFLDQCVRSVLVQSGVSLEVICVDDGSTDASSAILEQLAKLDGRIRVLRQENAGASVARNRGAELATGRYVCFVDSDDFWQLDGLADLVAQADRDNLDLLLFDAVSQRGAGVPDRIWERYRDYYSRGSYPGVRTGLELLAAMRANQEYRVQPCLYLIRGAHLRERGLRFY
ncbi:MAG: glycosyltransferase, partial [Propionicimonas sp.]